MFILSQFHEMSLNEIKSNESLNESIKMCLHLNESEKKFKDEIEKFLETNKSLTEDLKQKEAESEILYFDHFAKIINDIDLQREELKKRIDELSFVLIDKVKEIKLKFENKLISISAKKFLSMDEINKIENDFNKELRKPEFPQEIFKEIISNLGCNTTYLNKTLEEMKILNEKIKESKFEIRAIDLEAKVFGAIKEVVCV